MSRILRLFVAVLVGASALVLVPSTALAANPATDDAEVFCEVVPEFSTGVEAGVSSVAPGENVVVQNRLVFGEGDVFQDIVVQPDGSVFFASWLQLDLGASSIEYSPLTPTLTFNGALVTYQAGTEPAPGVYVFNAARNRMYLPGDPAVFGNGVGEVSISTVAGDELVVSYSGVVTSDVSGTSEQVAACSFSLASGDSNRTESATETFVGISDLEVNTTKSVEPSVVVAGQTVTYTIEVANPLLTSGGVQAGPAFNVAVNDSYDPALLSDPVVTSGSGVTVDAATPGQAVFTVGRIDAGETVTITYTQVVSAAAGAGTQVGNTATSSATSAPDAGGPYTVPFVGAGVTENVAVASDAPELTKTASASEAGENVVVDFSVEVVIPENSTYYDAVFYDIIPKGFQDFVATGGTITQTCGAATCPTSTVVGPETDPLTGEQRFGLYYETITTTTPLTITYTYSLTTGTIEANGLVVGEVLTNAAGFGFYAVPTLGGIEPNLAELPIFDGSVLDSEDVTFRRPVLEIEKTFLGDTPATEAQMRDGLPYSVTVTNTGNADATDVLVRDNNSSGFRIVPASLVGAVDAGSPVFTVPLVPAGDSVTVTYTATPSYGYTESEVENTARVRSYLGEDTEAYTPTDITDTASAELQYPLLEIEKSTPLSAYSTAQGTVVPFEFKLTNVSNVSAVNPRMVDAPNLTGGTFTAQNLVCDGALPWTLSSTATNFTMTGTGSIAPGVSVTCTVEMVLAADADPDTYTNTVDATWLDVFGKNRYRDPNFNTTFYTASAEAPYTLVDPALSIQKFPNADSDISIIQNGTSVYRIVVVNTGAVAVGNASLSDTLPAGVDLIATNPPTATISDPTGTTSATVANITGNTIRMDWVNIAPGARITILVPVEQDGTGVIGGSYTNVAEIDFDSNGAPLTDDGVLFFSPQIDRPAVTKTADSTTVAVNGIVTYTVTMDIPTNPVDLFDVTYRDVMPDGLEFVQYVTTPAPLTEVPPVANTTNGKTFLGWFVGDIPAGVGPTQYTVTYEARVLATLSTGAPAQAGTLQNTVIPLANIGSGSFSSTNLPDLTVPPRGQFGIRADIEVAEVDVVAPVIEITKVITSHPGPDDWSNAAGVRGTGYFLDVGERVEYVVTITNSGNSAANVVDFIDNMAEGDLTDIVYTITPPAGTTATVTNDIDTASDADGIGVQFDTIAAGATVTITYSGNLVASPDLVPAFTGSNFNVGRVDNTADVVRFENLAGLEFTTVEDAEVDVYVITPIPRVNMAACFAPQAAGEFGTFRISLFNNVDGFNRAHTTPGWPALDGPGALYDPVVELVISDELIVAEITSANLWRVRDGEIAPIVPVPVPAFATVDNGNGTQTVTITVANMEQSDFVTLQLRLLSTQAGSYGAKALFYGDDILGNAGRGDAVGADYVYSNQHGAGCGLPLPGLEKLPDNARRYPGETIEWTGTLWAAPPGPSTTAVLENVVFTDFLPEHVTFTPNTAEFDVTNADGSITNVSAAAGTVTETVTVLPDGRTQIVFESPAFVAVHLVNWRYDSTVDLAAPTTGPDNIFENTMEATYTNDVYNPHVCSTPATNVLCDTGTVRALSELTPLITKTVDDEHIQAGDAVNYTINVTIPANTGDTLFDVNIQDQWLPGDQTYMNVDGQIGTLTCVSGCPLVDPAPISYGFTTTTPSTATWFLGDLPVSTTDRVYEWTLPIASQTVNASVWAPPTKTSELVENTAYVNINQADRLPTTPDRVPTFNLVYDADVQESASASTTVYNHPGTVTKTCDAGTETPITSAFSYQGLKLAHGEQGEPNWRCTLTFDFSQTLPDGEEFTYNGFTMEDSLPISGDIFSSGGNRIGSSDLDTQIISITPDDPTNWTFVKPPSTTANDPTATPVVSDSFSGEYSGPVTSGDVFTIVVDLRVTAFESATSNVRTWNTDERGGSESVTVENTVELQTLADPYVPAHVINDSASVYSLISQYEAFVSKTVFRASAFHGDTTELNHGISDSSCPNFRQCDTGDVGTPTSRIGSFGNLIDVVPGETLTYAVNVYAEDALGLRVEDYLPPGYQYLAGSARLFTTYLEQPPYLDVGYVPLGDPAITGSTSLDCDAAMSSRTRVAQQQRLHELSWYERGGQTLAWTFTDTGDDNDPASANWYSELSAGPDAGHFTILFDVDTTGAAGCNRVTDPTLFKNIVNLFPTWPLNVETPPAVDAAYVQHMVPDVLTKLPTDGYVVDGASTSFTVRLDVNDPGGWTDLRNPPNLIALAPCDVLVEHDGATSDRNAPLPPFDELDACSFAPFDAGATYDRFVGMESSSFPLGTPMEYRTSVPVRTITDTFIDDGLYVDGSATVTGYNAWGDPVAATNIVSEDVARGIDAATGRPNVTITWTLGGVPMPLAVILTSGEIAGYEPMWSYGTSVEIDIPLDVPIDTVDGYQYFNEALSTKSSTSCIGDLAAYSCKDQFGPESTNTMTTPISEAMITVVNPAPPVVSKSAEPGLVAPGEEFVWNLNLELGARQAWFDLAFTDSISKEFFEVIDVGDPVCTNTATGDRCDRNIAVVDLTVTDTATSTDIAAFFDDVAGAGVDRTLTIPVRVRNSSGEVAGAVLENEMQGFSNEENLIDRLTEAPTGFFTDETVGEVTVIEPNLVVDKQVVNIGDGPFSAGDTLDWELTITNTGDAPAYSVRFEDRPDPRIIGPASAAVVPELTKNYTSARPWMAWRFAVIAPGESVTVTVSGTVRAGYEDLGLITAGNDAVVTDYYSGPPLDPDVRQYDPVADVAQAPLIAPNVTIAKYSGDCVSPGTTFDAGDSVAWCLVLTNNGQADSVNAVVSDALPVGWQLDTAVEPTLTLADGATTVPLTSYMTTAALASGGQLITFDLNTAGQTQYGTIGSGESIQITYNTLSANRTTVLNRASVLTSLASGDPVDGTPPGYFSTASAPAAPLGQGLEIIKTVRGNPADANLFAQECDYLLGCSVTWDVVTINTDQARLTQVSVVDYVPAGMTITSTTEPAGWTPAIGAAGAGPDGTTVITWTLAGNFDANGSAAFVIETSIAASPDDRSFLNTAVADSAETVEVEDQALATTTTVAPGSVGDYVWLDDDLDGVQDPSESGVEGVVVNLIDENGDVIATTTTDETGYYLFPLVAPGTYTVEFIAPPGLSPVPNGLGGDTDLDSDRLASGSTAPFTVGEGEQIRDIDSGWYVINSAIGIVKHVNGVDANTAPGVEVTTGDTVTFTYDITNTGDVGLVNVSLTDDIEGDIACPQASLSVGETMTCTVTAVAITGQYTNIGTVTADSDVVEGFDSSTVTADASANYLGSTTSTPSTSTPRGPTPPESTQPESTQPVSTQPVSTPSGPLSLTGANSGFLVLLGGLLVAGGAILVVVSRRRSRHESVQV